MSLDWDLLLQHDFVPVSLGKTTCKPCHRQVNDPIHQGVEVVDGLDELRAVYFEAERIQQTLMAQMASLGFGVNDQSLAIKRIELVLDHVLEALTTNEDRIKLETNVRKQICLALEDGLVHMRQQKLAVPNNGSKLIIPGQGQ